MWASQCGGFSCCKARHRVMASVIVAPGVQSAGSVVEGAPASVALQHVGSFQTRDKPVSPALAGRFFTTGPPGKPWDFSVLGLKFPHLGRNFSAKQIGMADLLTESVQFSRSVMSDSWRPHESQHTRPPCPSPTPRVYSNSCPSSC